MEKQNIETQLAEINTRLSRIEQTIIRQGKLQKKDWQLAFVLGTYIAIVSFIFSHIVPFKQFVRFLEELW